MPGSSASGQSGFHDKVNHHFGRLFASAVMMSALLTGVEFNQSRRRTGEAADFGSSLSLSLGQVLGRVASELLAKNLTLSPTLEVRPGYRFNIIVIRDLYFGESTRTLPAPGPREWR
jgi:type IV secretion system protein VirB10